MNGTPKKVIRCAIYTRKSTPLARCVWEGMSNPNTRRVAQKIRGNHSLRKQTLTSGLPIGSGGKCLMNWAHWVCSVLHCAGAQPHAPNSKNAKMDRYRNIN